MGNFAENYYRNRGIPIGKPQVADERIDQRIPTGAPWEISDDTGSMYEVRFDDKPGVPVMLYKGTYRALCAVFGYAPMSAEHARAIVEDLTNPKEAETVAVDPARLWDLIEHYTDLMRHISDGELTDPPRSNWHQKAREIRGELRSMLGLDPIP